MWSPVTAGCIYVSALLFANSGFWSLKKGVGTATSFFGGFLEHRSWSETFCNVSQYCRWDGLQRNSHWLHAYWFGLTMQNPAEFFSIAFCIIIRFLSFFFPPLVLCYGKTQFFFSLFAEISSLLHTPASLLGAGVEKLQCHSRWFSYLKQYVRKRPSVRSRNAFQALGVSVRDTEFYCGCFACYWSAERPSATWGSAWTFCSVSLSFSRR